MKNFIFFLSEYFFGSPESRLSADPRGGDLRYSIGRIGPLWLWKR